MACCIFAAMIISNVLFHWRRLKAFFGYHSSANPGLVTADSATPAPRNMALRYRLRRAALPSLLVVGTATYGSAHWQHMVHELGLAGPSVVAASTPIDVAFFDGAYEVMCD